jgi:hypothetical protein
MQLRKSDLRVLTIAAFAFVMSPGLSLANDKSTCGIAATTAAAQCTGDVRVNKGSKTILLAQSRRRQDCIADCSNIYDEGTQRLRNCISQCPR